jgi:hypothetical protein
MAAKGCRRLLMVEASFSLSSSDSSVEVMLAGMASWGGLSCRLKMFSNFGT